MITYIEGSLFTSTAQTLVNTVNTAGVMGKGLAKAFKTYYPEMFAEYAKLCAEKQFIVGQLLLYRTPHKWVLNFPTKRHWRQPSRLDDIEAGLETFVRTCAEQGVSSTAFPQLGCGNGGLDWEGQVRPLMERYLRDLPLDVQIFITPAPGNRAEVDERLVATWLQGDGGEARFETFKHDVATVSALSAIDEDTLWDVWRQLRREGVLLPEDVAGDSPGRLDALMASLTDVPYVQSTGAVRIDADMPYDARSTQARFEMTEARGVQFVPPLFQKLHPAPAPLTVELIQGCNGSLKMRQLEFSLAS